MNSNYSIGFYLRGRTIYARINGGDSSPYARLTTKIKVPKDILFCSEQRRCIGSSPVVDSLNDQLDRFRDEAIYSLSNAEGTAEEAVDRVHWDAVRRFAKVGKEGYDGFEFVILNYQQRASQGLVCIPGTTKKYTESDLDTLLFLYRIIDVLSDDYGFYFLSDYDCSRASHPMERQARWVGLMEFYVNLFDFMSKLGYPEDTIDAWITYLQDLLVAEGECRNIILPRWQNLFEEIQWQRNKFAPSVR